MARRSPWDLDPPTYRNRLPAGWATVLLLAVIILVVRHYA